jgi:hypothetical protein
VEKMKVEQIEEQKVSSKANMQKVKLEHVEEKSTSDIQVETIDQIYNQRLIASLIEKRNMNNNSKKGGKHK